MSHPELSIDRICAETPLDRARWLPEVDSTNSAALSLVATESSGAILIISDKQLAGRGRSGAEWWSGDGSLTFSLLIDKPELPPHEAPRVSLAVGLGVCRAAERFLPASPINLKWPNDVYVEGRKVAGILIEVPVQAPNRLVIGIGLNVNNRVENAPEDLQSTSTSLLDSLERPGGELLDRTEVLIECLNQVFSALSLLVDQPDRLASEIEEISLLTGRRVQIESPGSIITGVCRGISADGALLVETEEGLTPCYGGVVSRFS